jgi:hypothetical protein
MNVPRSKLADQFRTAIRASGIPLARLCEAIGIDQGTGSRFMAGVCGLSLQTLERLSDLLQIRLLIPPKRRMAMLAASAKGLTRIRFINNAFDSVVDPPLGIDFKQWEAEERERLRPLHGDEMTLTHYTLDILEPKPSDSVGLCKRRGTIPSRVFDQYAPKGIKR